MIKNFLILGENTPACIDLENMVIDIIRSLGIDAVVSRVSDLSVAKSYGVETTPALVIDEDLVISTLLPSREVLFDLIEKFNQRDV